MKISSLQMPKEALKSSNSAEINEGEFSQVLSQVKNKEISCPSKIEVTNLESNENNEEIVLSLEDSIVGMLSISFIEKRQQDLMPLDVNITVTNKETITSGDVEPDISINKNMDFTGVDIPMSDKKMPLVQDILPYKEDKLIKEKMIQTNPILQEEKPLLKVNEVLQNPNKDIIPKINGIENAVPIKETLIALKDETVQKIDGLSIKEATKELEPKIKVTIKENQEVNFMDSTQVKAFNKIGVVPKTIAQEPVLFNDDNLQKINDTIIQLMETTTEGNTNVIKVKLYPEDLGTVNVTLKMEEGKLIAKILVDNDYVKGLFTNKVNDLNEGLLKQNIHLEKINIDLNFNSNSETNSGFNLNQNGSFNQGRQNHSRRSQYGMFNSEFVNTAMHENIIMEAGAISILA